MKKILSLCVLFSITFTGLGKERVITGKVSNSGTPVENVIIQVVNQGATTTSNKDGLYKIVAHEGDILFYSAPGMEPLNIKVEDVTKTLNVEMFSRIEELDNVTVSSKRYYRTQQELKMSYWKDPNIIKTAFGFIDKDKVAYSIRVMEGDKILPGEYDLANVLRNRFAGINVRAGLGFGVPIDNGSPTGLNEAAGVGAGRAVTLRGGRAVFDIDGQIFTDFPDFIDVQNIQRLAVISSLAGVIKYGRLGRGGVIVINTKSGTIIPNDQKGIVIDQARLKNNFIKQPTLLASKSKVGEPKYISDWSTSRSFEQSKAKFEENSKSYSNSAYFVLDAYQHFYDTWNQEKYADDIIESNFDRFADNPVLLKALAYTYDLQGRYEKANEIYKEVFILRPHYAQSYLDLANSSQNLENNHRTAVLLARYFYLINEGFLQKDSTMFTSIVNREFDNLVEREKTSFAGKNKIKNRSEKKSDFEGTRLVFEWNDSEAEFDLQFVNPNNQYYTWKHSLKDNPDIIKQEKDFGYSCSEYLIDDFFNGIWKVNVNYLGNKSLTPTYLKATVYYDYGTPSQTKEVKVFKLNSKNVNQELFRINKATSGIARNL